MTEIYPESDSLFAAPSRQSQQEVAQIQSSWNNLVVSALSVASEIDPYYKSIPAGTVIRAIDAVGWSPNQNCDIRPRLLDKSTGEARLLDSGAQISATKRKPGDKLDTSVKHVLKQ